MALKPDALRRGTKLGAWRIVERLGFGGGGLVYRARRAGLDFAVKISRHSPADGDHATILDARFEREYLALKRLPGMANIATVYAFDRLGHPLEGHAYFIQELVEGSETIVSWAARVAPTMAQVADVFRQLALTLDELEARGLRHRDLKPSNILMAGGVPKLIDFGAAFLDGDVELTQHGDHPVSAKYISPEHCAWARLPEPRGQLALTPAAELHALGVVLYIVLTGEYPWQQDSELARRIVEEVPRSALSLNPALPPELDALLERLLRKNPSGRPQSGAQLAAELAVATRSEAPEWRARLRTKASDTRPHRRRRKGWVTGALLAVALGLGGAVVVATASGRPHRTVAEVDPPDAGTDHPPPFTTSAPTPEVAPSPSKGLPMETNPKPHKPKTGARLRAAVAAACVGAACPGVQLRPEDTSWFAGCSVEAAESARQLQLPREGGVIFADSGTVRNINTHAAEVRDGPVEGILAGTEFTALGLLRVGGDVVSVRFDRVRADSGTIYPVCMVAFGLGDEASSEAGAPKKPGTASPGFTLIGQNAVHVKIAR